VEKQRAVTRRSAWWVIMCEHEAAEKSPTAPIVSLRPEVACPSASTPPSTIWQRTHVPLWKSVLPPFFTSNVAPSPTPIVSLAGNAGNNFHDYCRAEKTWVGFLLRA
jgi:hypothetical protein